MGHKSTFESKVIVVWICSELLCSIPSVSIYYETQSNIRVKSYYRLNLLRASVFNYERLDMLRDSIGHPSKKLLSFDFYHSFSFLFRASRYTTGYNRTSESKVIVVWICSEILFSNSSVSIFYGTLSDIRVKSYWPTQVRFVCLFVPPYMHPFAYPHSDLFFSTPHSN